MKYEPDEPRVCPDCREMKAADDFNAKLRYEDGSVKTRQCYCKPCALKRARRNYKPKQRKAAISHDEVLRRKRERYREMMKDGRHRRKHRNQTRRTARKRRERAKNDPELKQRMAAVQRAWYRRMMADPERREEYLERQRVNARANGWANARKRWEAIKSDPERHAQYLIGRRITSRSEQTTRRFTNAIDAFRMEYCSLDAGPFVDWIRETYPTLTVIDISILIGVDQRQLRELLHYGHKSVSLRLVDRAFTNIGRPDLLNTLYPLEEAA
jgi:hypothetical protein